MGLVERRAEGARPEPAVRAVPASVVTVTSTPSPSAQRRALTSLRRIPEGQVARTAARSAAPERPRFTPGRDSCRGLTVAVGFPGASLDAGRATARRVFVLVGFGFWRMKGGA